jgi:hypothetical protein
MSPSRHLSGSSVVRFEKKHFSKGHYLTTDELLDLKEALLLHAIEEDELDSQVASEEEEAVSVSDTPSIDSQLAREIVEPFELDILATDE